MDNAHKSEVFTEAQKDQVTEKIGKEYEDLDRKNASLFEYKAWKNQMVEYVEEFEEIEGKKKKKMEEE